MLKQLFAVSLMNLQTLPQRLGASSVIVVGIAGVVAVLVSVLAMAAGFRHTVADSGRADRVIILRGGSDAELNSNLTRSDLDTIANAPGLRKDADGKALLSPELITVVNIPRKDTGLDSQHHPARRRTAGSQGAPRAQDRRRAHVSAGGAGVDRRRWRGQAVPRAYHGQRLALTQRGLDGDRCIHDERRYPRVRAARGRRYRRLLARALGLQLGGGAPRERGAILDRSRTPSPRIRSSRWTSSASPNITQPSPSS